MFVPDCFVMRSRTPGLPLMRVNAAEVLGRVLHLGDVPHVDGHALPGHHDQVADFVEVLELALAAHEIRAVAFVDLAERDVLVLACAAG